MDPFKRPPSPPGNPPPSFVVDDIDAHAFDDEPFAHSPSKGSFLAPPSAMSIEEDSNGDAAGGASDGGATMAAPAIKSPFNFQTQVISTAPVKSVSKHAPINWISTLSRPHSEDMRANKALGGQNIGQRRGHRYKHSSISTQHQIFQEPPPRPPPVLPASLPMPTLREAWKSMQKDQRTRLYWVLCHVAVAMYTFFKSEGSLAATALSHLVFFDAGSAAVCVAVDVLGNFEVWRRSSIRHPFGLERAEVLAGFAMSVFLLFGGFDLVSHNLKHVVESRGSHEHHEAEHAAHASTIDFVSLAAVASSLVSAYGLKNHARISKLMRVSYLAALPSILSNPFHFLTLFFAAVIALLPLLSISLYAWLDRLICAFISVAMFVLGMRLAVAQGLMLLMSYGGHGGNSGVSSVLRDIESDPSVTRVHDAQFWQVHYGLSMANLKIAVDKSHDDSSIGKLRSRITSLVQNRLAEGYGNGGTMRWEVTLQTSVDPVA